MDHLGPFRLSSTVWANLGSFGRHWPKNLVAQHSPQNSVSNLFGTGHPVDVEFMLIDGDFQERKKQHRSGIGVELRFEMADQWKQLRRRAGCRLQAGRCRRAISSTFLPPIPDPSTDRSQFPPPSNSATAHGSLADLRLSRPIKQCSFKQQILETFRFLAPQML